MSPEQPNPTPGGGGQTENVTLTRAEVDKLRADEQFMAGIRQEATEMGFDDPNQYVAFLQERKVQELTKNPPAAKPPENPPAQIPEEFRNQMSQVGAVATQGALIAQFTEYRIDYNIANPGKPLAHPKEELDKLIRSRPAVISEIAKDPKMGGNVYRAAAFLLDLPEMQTQTAQAAAAAALATEQAKAGVNLPSGQPIPAKPGQEGDTATQLRNIIAPKAGVYEGP